eukprot:tig00000870_g5155.t1
MSAAATLSRRPPALLRATLLVAICILAFAQVAEAGSKYAQEGDGVHDALRAAPQIGEKLELPEAYVHDGAAKKVDMSSGSASINLEKELGPLVVHEDGRLSRIANWEKMSEEEKARTHRVLTKRNRQRLARLRKERGEAPLEEASADSEPAAGVAAEHPVGAPDRDGIDESQVGRVQLGTVLAEDIKREKQLQL